VSCAVHGHGKLFTVVDGEMVGWRSIGERTNLGLLSSGAQSIPHERICIISK